MILLKTDIIFAVETSQNRKNDSWYVYVLNVLNHIKKHTQKLEKQQETQKNIIHLSKTVNYYKKK